MKRKFMTRLKENKGSLIVIAVCLIAFVLCALWANDDLFGKEEKFRYAEYENGKVLDVLSENLFQDETADRAYRGEQMLTVLVETGRYKGETLLTYNYVGPVYSVPVKIGDRVTIIISTYDDGSHTASVYELNRIPGILILVCFL